MAVTRINNNQITDAQTGNIYTGIDANTKLQNYSITSAKISNNLTYGSDLTITGNLTVQGNSTAVDTTFTTIEDPTILLASGQTGSPTVDIGYVGQRGTSENIAFVWQESSKEFVTAFTTTGETNTVVSISSYADFHTANANIGGNIAISGNATITGTTSLTGNLIGAVNATDTITGGNLATAGTVSANGTITGGNVSTAGFVTATGDITGGNVATGGTVSATGNVTAGNVATAGNVSATGNVTAANFIGNISGNVSSPGANTQVEFNDNGVTNATSGLTFNKDANILTVGNIMSAVGTAIVGNVSTAGYISATGDIFGSNVIPVANVTYSLGNTNNRWSTLYISGQTIHMGNIQLKETEANVFGVYLDDGVTLTQGNFASLSVSGNVTGGNINTSGVVSATGTVTGGNVETAGTVSATGDVTGGNLATGGTASATGTVTGGNLATAGTVSATGTATVGNLATGGTASATGTVTGGNLATGGTASASGNITGGNVLTGGLISATGEITGANLLTGGTVSATGTITGGNVATAGTVSATGTATAGNVATGGTVSATGNITGGNLITSGSGGDISGGGNISAGGKISATGNIAGGNIETAGQIYAAGNITANVASFFIGNGSMLTGVTASAVNANALTGNTLNSGVIYSSLQTVGTLTSLSVSGDTTSGNLYTGGEASIAGTVTGGNISTAGFVTATGDITGGNLATGGTVSSTGTVTGGNVATAGTVSSTGTVTGGNLVTGGTVSSTGTVTGGNVATAGTVSATGTVTGGNVATGGNVSAQGNVLGGNVVTDFVFSTAANTTITVNAQTISLNPTGNVGLNTRWINNLADPVADQDAATKFYVDSVAQGLDNKASVVAATSANISLSGPQTIDGVTIVAGNRVLVKNQTNAAENGIYDAAAGAWARSADANTWAELVSAYVFVEEGTTYADTGWVCTVGAGGTLGTTPITWTQFSGAGQYTSGNALSLNGTQFNVNIDTSGDNTIAINGSNELYIPSNAVLTTPNIGAATGTSVSVTGTVTGGNVETAGYVSATGDVTGGNIYTGGESSTTGTVTGGNLVTSGTANVTGTITGGNLVTGGTANVTGTITGGNLATGGTASVAGTVTGGNVSTAGFVTATGDITGGNVYTGGEVSATGNITVNTSSFFVGNGSMLTGVTASSVDANNLTGNTLAANVINSSLTKVGNLTTLSVVGTATVGNVETAGYVSATGDVTGGNIVTVGYVSATGDVTGGNIYTGGESSTTGTVTGGNLATTGTVSATGDITGGNVATGGTVSASGTITGGNVVTGGYASITGTVTGGNLVTAGTANVTGTITGGNVATGGTVSATGNVTGGNIETVGTVSSTGTVTGGNLVTGGTANVTGTITGGNVVTAGLISSTGDVTGGNIFTAGLISSTGTVTGGDLVTAGTANVTGTVTGGNVVTGGIVSAIGTVTGGNITTGGTVSATGDLLSSGNASATGNVIGSNLLTSGYVSATGNVYAANFVGNVSGNVASPGANTDVVFNDNGTTNATSGFTFDKSSNTVTVIGTVNGGNIATVGTVSANGTVTGGNVETAGYISATGEITGGNIYTSSTVSAVGDITGGNLSTVGSVYGGNIVISADDITDTNGRVNINSALSTVDFAVNGTTANVFYVSATSNTASFGNATQTVGSLVSFNSKTAITVPVGTQAERPATPSTGQFRFNTTHNSLEVYNNSAWTSVGQPDFTLITDEQFNGDGTTTVFNLSGNATTAGTIVSINGVQQIPVSAYAVAGNVLTFTEAPETGDLIDVRVLVTTTTVYGISNSDDTAAMYVVDGSPIVAVTGDLSVSGSILGGNINSTAIVFGSSSTTVVSSGGNIRSNVAGTTVQTISAGLVSITGDLTVSGNATLSGNILGDRIQNGTTSLDIQTPSGNANITVGGTSNVAVFAQAGVYITGNISATGDVVAQNVNSLSDATLKTNVTAIDNAEQVVNALNGVGYDWINGTGHAYGLIAQDVEQVVPEAVKTDENGIKSVNYQMLIPFLIETVKKQGEEIAKLKNK